MYSFLNLIIEGQDTNYMSCFCSNSIVSYIKSKRVKDTPF